MDERNDYNSIPLQHTQTAVEWLIEQCPRIETIVAYHVLEQAKQMEKEQMKEISMKSEGNMITDWLDQNRNPEIDSFIEKNLAITEKVRLAMVEITMAQQTAVEWLYKIYLQTKKIDSFDIEQAKQMEKKQIIGFHNWMIKNDTPENAEAYFHYSDDDMLNEYIKNKL